jgi:hypothetical protein
MRKIMVAVLVLLVSVVFGKVASAADWDENVLVQPDQKYNTYSLVNENDQMGCMVFLGENGSLEVGSCDWSSDVCILTQFVKISSEGKIISNKTNPEMDSLEVNQKNEQGDETKGFSKCVKKFQSLPAKARIN